ncbi:MAG: deoxyribodipyrimidine photo-lyase [Pseudomonadota bacterium]
MASTPLKPGVRIVWFKRDLRAEDHRPLAQAAAEGAVLPLYVVEPELWAQDDVSGRHLAFLTECLDELQSDLATLGQPLIIRTGAVLDVFEDLASRFEILGLFSHEETGNGWTYRRDQSVKHWCQTKGIKWVEVPQNGVIRGLENRNGWARRWDRRMAEPLTPAPHLKPLEIDHGKVPSAKALAMAPDLCPGRQEGGRSNGLNLLNSFLKERGEPYQKAMSSPSAGAVHCSRLSPHLAWGTLSMREIAQATWDQQRAIKNQPKSGKWRGALSSFSGRLHWHCHFMQKLEDQPEIETRNLHRAYDGLYPPSPDPTHLAAWSKGETGLPFIDACMRSLIATGWINFRMRAMLMSFASYNLGLHWRHSGLHLARLFTDYEPGIHWPQCQMQSGTTGINTVRIYNPIKQGHDHDTDGSFIRRWVPELADLSDEALHEPWKNAETSRLVGKAYPEPIVDPQATAKEARERIWAVRRGAHFRAEASAIQAKHGSRKSGISNRGRARSQAQPKTKRRQMDLPLGG